jgi:hypothetical protein
MISCPDRAGRGEKKMSMRSEMFGEGASTPWFRPESGTASGLVVCPMLPPGISMDASMAQEIYRLAYERAWAALRPSAYEIAQRVGWN